jgi:hypothetical protein
MNTTKTIIEKDLWYIDNFLTKEELDWFKPYMDDKTGWYTTMRSPYKNILNKFPFVEMPLDDNGNARLPLADDKPIRPDIFFGPGGIAERIQAVMPPTCNPHGALQTFKYCTDEEIERDLKEDIRWELQGNPVDFAMQFHSEWDETSPIPPFNLSFSIYLNDNFEGGLLDFMYKPYTLKPKAGMMVGVPVTKEFTHRVTKITSGSWRHTLYGNSFNDPNTIPLSTSEDC